MEDPELESNDFDILRNKNVIKLEKDFKIKIDNIQTAHKEYFKNRKSKYESESHDSLRNHFSTLQSGDTINIVWENNSDLREDIKNEVMSAFKSSFE